MINRHGGIFGKNPSIGSSADTVSNLPSGSGATGGNVSESESGSASRPSPQPKHCIIHDPYTSKKHFSVIGDNKGKFTICDLGSLNGTFVRRNFDPLLALGANASKVYGVQAAAVLQSTGYLGQGGRGMSPVMMCSSPTHGTNPNSSGRGGGGGGGGLAASINIPTPTQHGREGWGSGSWAGVNTPGSVMAAAAAAGVHPSLLQREGSSGSGDNSTSQSGSASVTHSGYASVGTQWLNSQSHGPTTGYRLMKNSVFLLGKCELVVVKIHDIDHPASDASHHDGTPNVSMANEDGNTSTSAVDDESTTPQLQSYHVVLAYTSKLDGTPSTGATIKQKHIGILGAKLGRHPDNDICLPSSDTHIDEFQSEVLFENGKFYLRDLHPCMDRGLWYRVGCKAHHDDHTLPISPTGITAQSSPLYNGDRIKVGMSEFNVSIRCIPPPLSITSQGSSYEIGTALEGNFVIQKEMQDRLVAIGNFGGHQNQAFFGIYDGHQERTVADFAAAAFHHVRRHHTR